MIIASYQDLQSKQSTVIHAVLYRNAEQVVGQTWLNQPTYMLTLGTLGHYCVQCTAQLFFFFGYTAQRSARNQPGRFVVRRCCWHKERKN